MESNQKKYKSFVSIVSILHTQEEVELLKGFYSDILMQVHQQFEMFEIILVNNRSGSQIDEVFEDFSTDLKKHCHIINLASSGPKSHAVLAGLDRANGDYTYILEFELAKEKGLLNRLYQRAQEGFDIVYVRSLNKHSNDRMSLFSRLFYYVLKKYSNLKIDEYARDSRIISRRSLNALLRMRENLRYMKAMYSAVGYSTSSITSDIPISKSEASSFSSRFRSAIIAITSYTTFLRTMMLWIFIASSVFSVLVVLNALMVKFTNYDLFGAYHEAISGWTFTVVMISIFFSFTFLNLYIISIYLSNIYEEIKQRPLYIIESIKRF